MDKMDAAVRAASSGSSAPQQKASLAPLGTDRSGRVVVYVDGDVAAARDAVKSAGGQVSDSDGQKLRAAVPATALEKLAGSRGITVVRRPEIPVEMAVISEGAQLSGALAWRADGKQGAGVKVGILDTGFGRLDEVQANGELPANVTVYNGQCGAEHGSSHGTSIAEVVHDMAPQSELFLACVTDSMDFDDAARWLKDQGVHVVNVSMGFPGTGRGSGLPDETQSVWTPATVVAWLRGNGIVVVAAAGNEAEKHMGGITADPENNGWMNISGASENQGFSIGAGERATVSLQWDAWNRTNQDFDLFVMDTTRKPTGLNDSGLGGRYSIQAQKETEGGLAPVETVTFENNTGQDRTFWIYVQRKEGTSTGLRYDLTIYGDVSGVQYQDPARSIAEPATSPFVIAVGAITPANAATGAVERSSSRGPTIDGRTKPDVTGFTSVTNYTWNGNTGTSVAAAHVTGAAAVYKGANPSLDPSQLEGLLLDSSSRLRRDNDFGYGVLNLGSPKVPQAPGGSAFTPLPVSRRVLDTNTDVGGHAAPLEPGETFTLRIPQLPADATAVMIDMTASTVVRPVIGDVSLEVFADTPVGIPTLHGQMSRYSKAVLTATLHPQDKVVRIKNSGVAVNLIADMYGYYSDQSASTFVPQSSPLRLSDTRTWGTSAPKLDAGETQTIKVREVPADATAVLVNVMATDPSAETHLELYGQTSLNKSTLVAYPGEETQTLALVPIPEDRAIRIKGIAGSAHAVVDLVGWYVNGSSGARYVPLRYTQPIFDSATGTQTPRVGFGSGQVRGFQVKGTARIPDTAVAMALGMTVRRIPVTETWTGTNVSLACHECGWRGHTNVSNPRGSSGVNLTRPSRNAVAAPIRTSGTMAVRNSGGEASVSIALSGYFVGGQVVGDAPLPAPTGYWKFDEGTGTTVADSSGNGRAVTMQGGASWTGGRTGASGSFNGTDGRAVTASPVIRTDQSFSVSAWTYLTRNDGQHTAISQEGIRNSPFLLAYSKTLDRWAFSTYLSDADDSLTAWVTASAPPRLNEWTQLTAVYDAAAREMRIYVNGALDGVTTGVTMRRTDAPLMIGRNKSRATYEGYFPGRVDETRTYDRALTDSDVRRLHQGTDALLVSGWAFDEGSGTIARDSTPRADHGTLTGGASWTPGRSGTAVQLDGGDDSVEMPERAVAMKDSFTVTAWANPSTAGLWRAVVSQGGQHRSGFVVTFEPSLRKWMAVVTPADDNGSASTEAVSEHPVALNQWSHLAAVYDAAARQLRLYVNGNLTGWADGVTTWDARSWFAVGRGLWQGSRTDYFAGAVDDVRTYQGILPDEQIRLLAAG